MATPPRRVKPPSGSAEPVWRIYHLTELIILARRILRSKRNVVKWKIKQKGNSNGGRLPCNADNCYSGIVEKGFPLAHVYGQRTCFVRDSRGLIKG